MTQSGEIYPAHGGYLRGQFNPLQVILGAYSTSDKGGVGDGGGRVVVYCDSALIDMKPTISRAEQETETLFLNSLLNYLSYGVVPNFMTRPPRGSAYEDQKLMNTFSSKQHLDTKTLQEERDLRLKDFQRSLYAHLSVSPSHLSLLL
jgi:hypothetical protein